MCSCRKYPSSWQYYQTMDKFLTKTDNVINHTAVKITAADRMKLPSETFVQGFANKLELDNLYEPFFSLSLINTKLSFSWLNKDLFVGHNIVQSCTISRTINVFTAQFVPQILHNLNFLLVPCQMP